MEDLMTEIDQVVTPDIEARLIDLRDRETLTSWDLGRVINDLYGEVKAKQVQRTKVECCVYVARFIDSRDRSLPSMKVYAHIAEIFPGRVIGKGADKHLLMPEDEFGSLPFSHFIAAARYGDQKFKVLKESQRLMDKRGGRTVSADALERHMEALGIFPVEAGPDHGNTDTQEPGQEDDAPMFNEPEIFDTPSIDPALASLKAISQDAARLARDIQDRFPFWAKAAGQLGALCGRIVREIEESTIEVGKD